MIATYALTFVRAGLVAAGLALGAAAPALAQNSEGTYQVRFGAFGQFGNTTLNGETGALSGSGHTGGTGAGVTASFDVLRSGRWTYGVEIDGGVTGAGQANVVGARYGADYFASLRGRVGVYVRPDWVLYGTGGLGFRGVSITDAVGKSETTLTGSVFGGGVEHHRGSAILFAEYLHGHFGSRGLGVPVTTPVTQYRIGGDTNAFRLGVKFKLGYDGYHDDVRDGLRK